jgi:hypothetical protein
MQGDTPGSLVALAATGDEVAFERIVAAYHDDMARVCFVICHDVESGVVRVIRDDAGHDIAGHSAKDVAFAPDGGCG